MCLTFIRCQIFYRWDYIWDFTDEITDEIQMIFTDIDDLIPYHIIVYEIKIYNTVMKYIQQNCEIFLLCVAY